MPHPVMMFPARPGTDSMTWPCVQKRVSDGHIAVIGHDCPKATLSICQPFRYKHLEGAGCIGDGGQGQQQVHQYLGAKGGK